MVTLAESSDAFALVLDAWVFDRRLELGRDRHLEDGPSAGLQHPMQLAHPAPIVVDMLENVIADYGVETIVLERQIQQVGRHHRRGVEKIRAEIVDFGIA